MTGGSRDVAMGSVMECGSAGETGKVQEQRERFVREFDRGSHFHERDAYHSLRPDVASSFFAEATWEVLNELPRLLCGYLTMQHLTAKQFLILCC